MYRVEWWLTPEDGISSDGVEECVDAYALLQLTCSFVGQVDRTIILYLSEDRGSIASVRNSQICGVFQWRPV